VRRRLPLPDGKLREGKGERAGRPHPLGRVDHLAVGAPSLFPCSETSKPAACSDV
jgi:hypothetical protein